MKNYLIKRVGESSHAILFLLLLSFTPLAAGQTYTVVYDFGTNPGDPFAPISPATIAQGRDGNLYSTARDPGNGAMFRITPTGTLETLHDFSGGSDGSVPVGGLTLGTDGNFYGTTTGGGTGGNGTIFRITPDGNLTTLYAFTGGLDGASPSAAPVQAPDGNFYGTTIYAGRFGYGTFYRITPSGTFSVWNQFAGWKPCGLYAPLTLAIDGNFYGASLGPNSVGKRAKPSICRYEITSHGVTMLASLPGTPAGSMIQASDGKFYGDDSETIFRFSPPSTLEILHSFNATDGFNPTAGLAQATDGNFYGVTTIGGAYDDGTLFKITSDGTFTKLHDFQRDTGSEPEVTLLQNTNGKLYGDTSSGGTGTAVCGIGCGGVFYSVDIGAGPFVTFPPAQSISAIGTSVGILGNGLSSTTQVSFGGVPASFTISSDTFLTAIVPSGALTGPITVATSGQTLTSNKPFRVRPVIDGFKPKTGPVGTAVAIKGLGLTQTTQILFGTVPATSFTVDSDSQVTAIVPTGGTGRITLSTAGGKVETYSAFTIN